MKTTTNSKENVISIIKFSPNCIAQIGSGAISYSELMWLCM